MFKTYHETLLYCAATRVTSIEPRGVFLLSIAVQRTTCVAQNNDESNSSNNMKKQSVLMDGKVIIFICKKCAVGISLHIKPSPAGHAVDHFYRRTSGSSNRRRRLIRPDAGSPQPSPLPVARQNRDQSSLHGHERSQWRVIRGIAPP